MSLSLPGQPLATRRPTATNYTIDGPAHLLLATPFPRRVRALFAGEVVLDTRRGQLLHESNMLPRLYVPREDVRSDLLERTDTATHCPFKGDASYWSIRVPVADGEDALAVDAVWAYEDPKPEVAWLAGLVALYWDRVDGWFDEDEPVRGHLRDPYHRVDTRASSARVVVRAHDEVVADSTRARVLSETGLPNRWYVPADDVRRDLLRPSAKTTHCPYKGSGRSWSLEVDGTVLRDVAWTYTAPFPDGLAVRDHLCFLGEGITTEVDGVVIA